MNLPPVRLVAAHALALVLSSTARAVEPLPIEAFAALPHITAAALSPDGRHFAAVVHEGDATLVLTRPLDTSEPPKLVMRNDEPDFQVNWARFVRDDRLLVSVRYTGQMHWNRIGESRLIAFDRDGGHMKVLMEPRGWQRNRVAQFQDDVVDWLPGDGHHILLALQAEARDPARALWRVDVDSGEREIVRNPAPHVVQWFTDARHQPRATLAQTGTEVTIQVCDADGTRWRDAWRYDLRSDDRVQPLGFGDDPDTFFVEATQGKRRSVFEVDLKDPALPRRLVLEGRQGKLLVDPRTHRALGVTGRSFGPGGVAHAADRYWDADTRKLMDAVDAALPGQGNRLQQLGEDGSHYLLFTSGNGMPGRFMVGDRASGQLSELGAQYPGLPPARLARKAAMSLPSSDGSRIAAFLTLPQREAGAPARAPARALPAVIVPQGAPIGHDSLDFDAWVDFLADRGYAVLQVEVGAEGPRRQRLLKAGLQRQALAPQDDLADAAHWLVQRGTADPSRLCVMGGGFGGYAALMAGARTPGLFRCVVAVGGISDLVDLGNFRGDFFNGKAVYESLVGSPWEDRERLDAASPRTLAADFRAPVLLLHGTADPTVPYAQGEDMAKALRSAGKDVRLVTQQDGDHALSHAAHRLQAFREVDAFLAANLAPAARTATAAQVKP
jgi:dipeptidyl aminopeptidase/acylaminoacyl peptidase